MKPLQPEKNPPRLKTFREVYKALPYREDRGQKIRSPPMIPNPHLVGGWTNPIEKYARQIGSSGKGEHEIIFELPPPNIWLISMVNVDKYTIYGSYGNEKPSSLENPILSVESLLLCRQAKNAEAKKRAKWLSMAGRFIYTLMLHGTGIST